MQIPHNVVQVLVIVYIAYDANAQNVVRLVGGHNERSGRVEVFTNGEWGTVCDDRWGIADADVICRQMGYGNALSAPVSAYFGQGTGTIQFDEVRCSGTELSIFDCESRGVGVHNCRHYEDAGVVCREPIQIDVTVNATWCGFGWQYDSSSQNCYMYKFIRPKTWGEAEAICIQSGGNLISFSSELDMTYILGQLNDFGTRERVLWIGATDVEEEGTWRWSWSDGYSLSTYLNWNSDEPSNHRESEHCAEMMVDTGKWNDVSCNSELGYICKKHVRLVGGNHPDEGRVDIHYDGQWVTLCQDDWDITDANVVCRQLGYVDAIEAAASTQFDKGDGPFIDNDVRCNGTEDVIANCMQQHTNVTVVQRSDNCAVAGVICRQSIRLVGGNDLHEGRVDVFYDNEWTTICEHDWDITDAGVVCRQLGYPSALEITSSSQFDKGDGPFLVDHVHCDGTESAFATCIHQHSTVHDCDNDNVAGVVCSQAVRLVGGNSAYEGRVEIFSELDKSWGTVCGNRWRLDDANVVCHHLNYGPATKIFHNAYFGEGSGAVNMIQCMGTELNITACLNDKKSAHNCSHAQDVGVQCQIPVRLVGGNTRHEGNVQMYTKNDGWGMVCGEIWNFENANVVCRTLNYGPAAHIFEDAHYGTGSGPVHSIECIGTEPNVTVCSIGRRSLADCPHSRDAGVKCQSLVHLVGGDSPYEGRVEIFSNDDRSWGTVCGDTWDLGDASVVCQHLQYGPAIQAFGNAQFGEGSGMIHSVQCAGTELKVTDCSTAVVSTEDCSHEHDAGVKCQSPVRIVNGVEALEGRVEVYYNGMWVVVCGETWNQVTANLACQQMGYGNALTKSSKSKFGRGSKSTDMINIMCREGDTNLLDCQHNNDACKRAAGVRCSSAVPIIHPCDRPCSGDVRTCEYTWNVEYYHSMLVGNDNSPCSHCPSNPNDCNLTGCVSLNGVTRPIITVNRQVPGPKIIVCKNDTIVVSVKNSATERTGLTIHWHGVNLEGTPAMDGSAFITQCPIPYSTTFVYKFKASDAGTYFWHSDVGTTRADGLAGPLIIRESDDIHQTTYDFDESSHILFLQDWLFNFVQNPYYDMYQYSEGNNQPHFLLINGKGRGLYDGNVVPGEILYVEEGKRYRFRVISNSFTGCPLEVSIDNHRLTAITMDSYPIHTRQFDAVILNAGERFDFVLDANQAIGNYWLSVVGAGANCNMLEVKAILRYSGAPLEDPTSSTSNLQVAINVPERPFKSYPTEITTGNLRSLVSYTPTNEKNTYYMHIGLNNVSTSDDTAIQRLIPQINHISFKYPPAPLLTQHNDVDNSLFCDARNASKWKQCIDNECSCTHMISAKLHETVELFFYNDDNNTSCYSLHLHGFSFRVVGQGHMLPIMERHNVNGPVTSEQIQTIDESDTDNFPRNLTYPVNKDTVCVSHGTYTIIQFVADNPGWWFLNCQLDFNAMIGMAFVVRVGTDADLEGKIPTNFPRCGNFSPIYPDT